MREGGTVRSAREEVPPAVGDIVINNIGVETVDVR